MCITSNPFSKATTTPEEPMKIEIDFLLSVLNFSENLLNKFSISNFIFAWESLLTAIG